VGAATRWIEYVQRMPKRYVGTFLLGRQSPTEDVEGEVTELLDAPVPTREQIAAAAERFVGRIEQRPPAFSALKVAGRRAYELARRGQRPQLAARPVEIHRIEIKGYQYPELVLDVACGSGTYIRSLGRDLAESLSTAAVMSGLVRTAIGGFRIEDAVDPHALKRDNWLEWLQPTLRAVEYLPRLQLSADEAERVRNGLPIERRTDIPVCQSVGWDKRSAVPPTSSSDVNNRSWWDSASLVPPYVLTHAVSHESGSPLEIVAIGPAGQLVGILSPGDHGELRTLRNMPISQQAAPVAASSAGSRRIDDRSRLPRSSATDCDT
jgi:tRNA pseudouridine(55) synthase